MHTHLLLSVEEQDQVLCKWSDHPQTNLHVKHDICHRDLRLSRARNLQNTDVHKCLGTERPARDATQEVSQQQHQILLALYDRHFSYGSIRYCVVSMQRWGVFLG